MQALGVHLFHVRHRYPFEQGDALAQAFLVIGDFAAHGRFGDGGHLRFAPGGIGYLVYTLDIDERGIHVKRNQFEVG